MQQRFHVAFTTHIHHIWHTPNASSTTQHYVWHCVRWQTDHNRPFISSGSLASSGKMTAAVWCLYLVDQKPGISDENSPYYGLWSICLPGWDTNTWKLYSFNTSATDKFPDNSHISLLIALCLNTSDFHFLRKRKCFKMDKQLTFPQHLGEFYRRGKSR